LGKSICYPTASKFAETGILERDQELTKSSSASGAGHVLGSRYASSFIGVAAQSGAIASIEKDMATLQSSLGASKELQSLLDSPVYSKDAQLNAMQEIARKAGFHQLTINFLGVLTTNGRLGILPAILFAFFREMERRHGVVEAKVVSAFPLTESQQKNLIDNLSKSTGKSVRLDLQIDKSLLGGMVVTVGSRMVDDSIKTRLNQLKQAMLGSKAA
jgi:F-type H+-transporting ATPase subunit delta